MTEIPPPPGMEDEGAVRSLLDRVNDLPHIIIVGGGAGGLELATRLGDKLGRKKKAQISLDRQVAHAHLEAAAARDRRRQHGRRPPRARVSGAGPLARLPVSLRRDDRHRPLPASACHLAATCRRGRPADHAGALVPLRYAGRSPSAASSTISARRASASTPSCSIRREQAERFNRRLINACVRAYAQPGPIRPGQLHVAIIGAGATGTELVRRAASSTARGVVAFGLDKIDPDKDIKITLIEAAPRILPALPERMSMAVSQCPERSRRRCAHRTRASPR